MEEAKLNSKERLSKAYKAVFKHGKCTKMDIELVLNDLYKETYLSKPIKGDAIERAEKEGARQVGLRISEFLDLDLEYFRGQDRRHKRKLKDLQL